MSFRRRGNGVSPVACIFPQASPPQGARRPGDVGFAPTGVERRPVGRRPRQGAGYHRSAMVYLCAPSNLGEENLRPVLSFGSAIIVTSVTLLKRALSGSLFFRHALHRRYGIWQIHALPHGTHTLDDVFCIRLCRLVPAFDGFDRFQALSCCQSRFVDGLRILNVRKHGYGSW